jgi:glutamate racemase
MAYSVDSPITVFDSGIGGLSVLRYLRSVLPLEHFVYVADSMYVPYGDKPLEFVVARSEAVARYARARGSKALVIPCNTATAAAAQHLRGLFPDWLVVGVEPAVKPAAFQTKTGVVGILATTNTLTSEKFRSLVERFSSHAKVLVQPCPGLVECIEAGDFSGDATRSLLRGYVSALTIQGADILVLGCTHYPFVADTIAELAGPSVTILETGQAVARETARRLNEANLLSHECGQGQLELLTTGSLPEFLCLLNKLGDRVIEFTRVAAINSVQIN